MHIWDFTAPYPPRHSTYLHLVDFMINFEHIGKSSIHWAFWDRDHDKPLVISVSLHQSGFHGMNISSSHEGSRRIIFQINPDSLGKYILQDPWKWSIYPRFLDSHSKKSSIDSMIYNNLQPMGGAPPSCWKFSTATQTSHLPLASSLRPCPKQFRCRVDCWGTRDPNVASSGQIPEKTHRFGKSRRVLTRWWFSTFEIQHHFFFRRLVFLTL